MPIDTELTTLEDDRVRLDVSVSKDEVQKAVDSTLKQLARDVRIPGFRPGKVPPTVVMNRFGRDVVVQEMLKNSIGGWYESAVAETGIRPIDDPELDMEGGVPENDALTFTATVQTRPKATLGTWQGLDVGRDEVELPEGQVDAELGRLRDRAARLTPVERAAAAGDFVVISFDGHIGTNRVAAASARDYMVELGAGRLMTEFDEALVGMSAGDETKLSVEYAADDNRPELAGATVDYTLTLAQVQEKRLPDLDDDFAQEISEFDSLAELTSDIEAKLTERAEAIVDEAFRRRAIDAAVAGATVEVPQVMTDRRINSILNQTASQLPKGVSFEQYLEATGRTLDETVEGLRPDAEMALKRELVVEAIAEAEGVEITDADVENQIRDDAVAMGRDAEELIREVHDNNAFESLRDDLRMRRAVEALVAASNPVAVTGEDEAVKISDDGEENEAGEANESPGEST